jgi:hypothetical protein
MVFISFNLYENKLLTNKTNAKNKNYEKEKNHQHRKNDLPVTIYGIH